MIEVALEASARPGSIAVRRGERRAEAALSEESAHASDLLGALAGGLESLGGEPGSIGAVLVGTGPGSFTGLRVAIATAMGIARGTGASMRGVPSFEALAFGRLEPGEEAFVVLDAYSAELYLAHYRRESDDVTVLAAPRVVSAGPIEVPEGARVFGDEKGWRAAGLDRSRHELLPGAPSARDVLELGAKRLAAQGPQAPGSVEPLYLRPFAAKKRRR